MPRLPLRRQDGSIRAFALVDDADFDELSQHRWCLSAQGYVVRRDGSRIVPLHRELLGLHPGDGLTGDHINRNRLDNRRANLRVATHAQNSQNHPGHRGRTSRYRGVSFDRSRKKWRAQVHVGAQRLNKRFDTEQEAAEAAREYRAAHMPFATN